MSIYVSTGRFARRKLIVPKGDHIRPSTAQLRAALCNILSGYQLNGARVLELFAGSGAIGFELLSSGAAHIDFVENHPLSVNALRQNQLALSVQAETTIYSEEAFHFLTRAVSKKNRYTFLFADPPYVTAHSTAASSIQPLLPRLLSLLDHTPELIEEGGVVIFEKAKKDLTPLHSTQWHCIDERVYGDSVLLFWKRAS